ncbi:MAG: thiamine-phosphate kinase [Chloroflexi bacterium]|nr:thiamine-phosphate kinase [Chloroflexota bacterium]
MGEFGLIERLSGVLGSQTDEPLLHGIGDDAAAWRQSPDRLMTATSDSLVEGVHFDLRTTSWRDLGWKALAENLSDIAAMGCEPRYALIGLGLPRETAVADVEALYAGIRECAEAFGCAVVGGDTTEAPLLVLHVTVLGESIPVVGEGEPLLTRAAARPGDVLAVTGPLGASAAGLKLLQSGDASEAPGELLRAHRRPQPRVHAGAILVRAGVRCGIDISDGLLADVGHICERSGVDAEVDLARVPVHPLARTRFGKAAVEMALVGGEDYELVCAGSESALSDASVQLRARGESALTILGSIVKCSGDRPEVRVLQPDGRLWTRTEATGYQHFAKHGLGQAWPGAKGELA